MKGKRRSEISEVADIEERNGYFRTITSSFDRTFIDKHGLKQGIYNLYSKTIEQGEYRCEEVNCNDELLVLDSRIIAAIDVDGDIYKYAQLQPELAEILIGTNKRVILCMKHKSATAFVLGEQKKVANAKLIPFMKAHGLPEGPKKPRR